MVKYLALAVALVASLVIVDMAQAGRRCHGGCCGGGCYAGGCPGGVCPAPVAPAPVPAAAVTNAPPTVVVNQAAPVASPAPVYYTSAPRRGLFGWRR
ncbi:MAG TPA: hypothetical protein VFV87_08195 [Pirellulaceae bacterium]|nr:hypothetical protein [Pirellulaceae bacterium]